MDNIEARETIRQMLADWNAATPEQREAALRQARDRAEAASRAATSRGIAETARRYDERNGTL